MHNLKRSQFLNLFVCHSLFCENGVDVRSKPNNIAEMTTFTYSSAQDVACKNG